MSDQTIAENCAPTLAGIKTGNLFSTKVRDAVSFQKELCRLNHILTAKGMRAVPVRYMDGRALIYLYRPDRLSKDIRRREVAAILKEQGYTLESADRAVVQLVNKLKNQTEFPHEIGVFLGYPAEDVRAFMHDSHSGFKLVGYWKVYGDKEKAMKIFDSFSRCTATYCRAIKNGKSLEQLIS
ncbi:MAG: DUF3793 family protein [Lachnospiraceae bacterium]|nr:DUF3793 family protein [Lachnospiraceae bacterium]